MAQGKLSLREAIQLALQQNKSLQASRAAVKGASTHIQQARAGMLPAVDYSESLTRGNNPVFVFSSLLEQRQFAVSNFQINSLNRPAFLNNFQSSLTVNQTLFDGGRARKAVRSAELTRDMSSEEDRQTRTEVMFSVIKAYLDAVLSRDALQAASDAVQSAEADLARAESIRQAGMSTDADVLSIRVNLAAVREQQIRREADVTIAQAALNDALGLSLESRHELSTPLASAKAPDQRLEDFERLAVSRRPEQLRAKYEADLASTKAAIARSSLLPKVSVRGIFEVDRQDFAGRGASNWLGAISLSWNLFNGFSDKARIEEAKESLLRAQAEQQRMHSAVRLEVRRAWVDLRTAEEQIKVAGAAVAEAQESLRITQNRYESGLNTVTDLLRAEAAVLESRTRYLSALHDQRIAAALLDVATGSLSLDSPAIQEGTP
jgi:outer membrane protein TolC